MRLCDNNNKMKNLPQRWVFNLTLVSVCASTQQTSGFALKWIIQVWCCSSVRALFPEAATPSPLKMSSEWSGVPCYHKMKAYLIV